jgi:hypothetical protein
MTARPDFLLGRRGAGPSASIRSTVARQFALLLGQPLMQYLTQRRLQVAANLLTQRGAKLAAIGAEVGLGAAPRIGRSPPRDAGAGSRDDQSLAELLPPSQTGAHVPGRAPFLSAPIIASDRDTAQDIPGVQNLWVQGLRLAAAGVRQ